MPRSIALVLVLVIGVVAGLGVIRARENGSSAAEQLAALSAKSADLSYYARYEAVTGGERDPDTFLVAYAAPSVGYRWDFFEPIELADEPQTASDPLAGGDTLIVRVSDETTAMVSCRTARRTCRTADGLERLALVSFLSLMRYDRSVPFFAQPHTVSAIDDAVIAGEIAKCFRVDAREPSPEETPPSGFVAGEGFPVTLCYAADGLLLRASGASLASEGSSLDAVEIGREVDPGVFEPPYPVVPSVYDE